MEVTKADTLISEGVFGNGWHLNSHVYLINFPRNRPPVAFPEAR